MPYKKFNCLFSVTCVDEGSRPEYDKEIIFLGKLNKALDVVLALEVEHARLGLVATPLDVDLCKTQFRQK